MSARAGIIDAKEAMKSLIQQGYFGAIVNGLFLVMHPQKGVRRPAPPGMDKEAANEWFAWQQQGGGLRATPLDREGVRVE